MMTLTRKFLLRLIHIVMSNVCTRNLAATASKYESVCLRKCKRELDSTIRLGAYSSFRQMQMGGIVK